MLSFESGGGNSQYFRRSTPVLSRKYSNTFGEVLQYCLLFTIVSFLIGMFGLKTIIVSTIPVLMFVYPLCVILIVLLFTDKLFDGRQCVYAFTTAFTFVMAAVSGLETAGVNLGAISEAIKAYVPFAQYGLAWVPFAVTGYVLGLAYKAAVPCKACCKPA